MGKRELGFCLNLLFTCRTDYTSDERQTPSAETAAANGIRIAGRSPLRRTAIAETAAVNAIWIAGRSPKIHCPHTRTVANTLDTLLHVIFLQKNPRKNDFLIKNSGVEKSKHLASPAENFRKKERHLIELSITSIQ